MVDVLFMNYLVQNINILNCGFMVAVIILTLNSVHMYYKNKGPYTESLNNGSIV